MSAPPEVPGTAAAATLGDRAYPESQVSHGGGTYWLERSADGAKRLVAVVPEESAVRGFEGSVEAVDGGFRLVAETTSENARALRSALPWLTPSRFGLHTSAGFGDRLGLATPGHVRALQRGRRGDQPRVRPAVDPRDGPLRAYAVRRSRRCDLGGLPGGVDQPGRR